VASLSQGRTAAAQCGLFTYKSVPVIFEPPCTYEFGTKFSTFFVTLLKILCIKKLEDLEKITTGELVALRKI